MASIYPFLWKEHSQSGFSGRQRQVKAPHSQFAIALHSPDRVHFRKCLHQLIPCAVQILETRQCTGLSRLRLPCFLFQMVPKMKCNSAAPTQSVRACRSRTLGCSPLSTLFPFFRVLLHLRSSVRRRFWLESFVIFCCWPDFCACGWPLCSPLWEGHLSLV
jgi:hypothetical protein